VGADFVFSSGRTRVDGREEGQAEREEEHPSESVARRAPDFPRGTRACALGLRMEPSQASRKPRPCSEGS
jgi:hypothetical protein